MTTSSPWRSFGRAARPIRGSCRRCLWAASNPRFPWATHRNREITSHRQRRNYRRELGESHAPINRPMRNDLRKASPRPRGVGMHVTDNNNNNNASETRETRRFDRAGIFRMVSPSLPLFLFHSLPPPSSRRRSISSPLLFYPLCRRRSFPVDESISLRLFR